jgi:hypothetical protein
MEWDDAPHLRIIALFAKPGRLPVPEPEMEPQIVLVIEESSPRPNISIWTKSAIEPSIRQFPAHFLSDASQNNSLGLANPPKSSISVFL